MASEDSIPKRPQNPVRVRTRREEDLHELLYTGVLFDDDGRPYRYRTNEDLILKKDHVIRAELEMEVIVRITDAWAKTGQR